MFTSNDIIGFHSPDDEYGYMSNWYHAEFDYAGRHYVNSEQYMMFQKVALGKRYDLADLIMSETDPAKIKEYGGKNYFDNFLDIKPVWDAICKNIVKYGVKAKFAQNSDIFKALLDTGNALLCECAGSDTIWGIGINIKDTSWKDVSNWRGHNYLGKILMEIREEFRYESAILHEIKYVDYRDTAPSEEWNMCAAQLKQIPQYCLTVKTYAEQLPTGRVRDTFYTTPLCEWETAMRVNMGGGLPISGFYEMKQQIYETARLLNSL